MLYWELLKAINLIGNIPFFPGVIISIMSTTGSGRKAGSGSARGGKRITQSHSQEIINTRETRSRSREARDLIAHQLTEKITTILPIDIPINLVSDSEETNQQEIDTLLTQTNLPIESEEITNLLSTDINSSSNNMTTQTIEIEIETESPTQTTSSNTSETIGSTISTSFPGQGYLIGSNTDSKSISSTSSEMSEQEIQQRKIIQFNQDYQRQQTIEQQQQRQLIQFIPPQIPIDVDIADYYKIPINDYIKFSLQEKAKYRNAFNSLRDERFYLSPMNNQIVHSNKRMNIPHNDPILQAQLHEKFGQPDGGCKYWNVLWLNSTSSSNTTAATSSTTQDVRSIRKSQEQIMLEKQQIAEKAILADQEKRKVEYQKQADAIYERELAKQKAISQANSSSSTFSNSNISSTISQSSKSFPTDTSIAQTTINNNKWVPLIQIDPGSTNSNVIEYARNYYRESHLFCVEYQHLLAINTVSRDIVDLSVEYEDNIQMRFKNQQKEKEKEDISRRIKEKLDKLEWEKEQLNQQRLELEKQIESEKQSIQQTGSTQLPFNVYSSSTTLPTSELPVQAETNGQYGSRTEFTRTHTGFSSGNGFNGPPPNGNGPGRNGKGSGGGKGSGSPGSGPPNGPGRGSGFPSDEPDPNRGGYQPAEDIRKYNNESSLIKNYIVPKTISNTAKFEDTTKWISFKNAFLANAQQYNYVDWLIIDSRIHWIQLSTMYADSIRMNSLYLAFRQVHKQIFGLIKTCILKIYSSTEMLEQRTLQSGLTQGYSDTTTFTITEKIRNGGAFADFNCYLLWNTLSELYQKRLSMDLVKSIRDMYSFHWNIKQDISQQLSYFQQLLQKLNEASSGREIIPGHLLPQSVEASFLLASLPIELEQVNVTLGTQENITVDQVFSTIQSVISNSRARKAYNSNTQYAHFSSTSNHYNNNKYNNNNKNNSFKNKNGFKKNNYKNFNSNSNSGSNSNSYSNYNNNNNKQSYSFITGNDENEEDNNYDLNNENEYEQTDNDQNYNDSENDQNQYESDQQFEFGSNDENDDNNQPSYSMIANDFSHQLNNNENEITSDSENEFNELNLPIPQNLTFQNFDNVQSDEDFDDNSNENIIIWEPIIPNPQVGGATTIDFYDNNTIILPSDYYNELNDVELESSILSEIHSSDPDGIELAEMIKVIFNRCQSHNIHLSQYSQYINYRKEILEIPMYSSMEHQQLLAQIHLELINDSPNYQHFYNLIYEQIKRYQKDIELGIKKSMEYLQNKLKECIIADASNQTTNTIIDSSTISLSNSNPLLYNVNNQIHSYIIESDQKENIQVNPIQSSYSLILHDNLALTSFDEMLSNPYTFVLDSGATRHVTGNQRILFDVRQPKYDFTIKSIYGHFEKVKLIGSIKITPLIKINNVHYLPGAKYNLISVSKLNERRVEITFTESGAYLKHAGKTFLTFRPVMGLFVYQNTKYAEKEQPSIEYIHRPAEQIIPRPSNKNQPISTSSNSSVKPTTKPGIIPSISSIRAASSSSNSTVIPSIPTAKPIHPRRKIPRKKQFQKHSSRPTTRSSTQSPSTATTAMSLMSHHRDTIDLTTGNDDDEMHGINNDYALSTSNVSFASMFGDKVQTRKQDEYDKQPKYINEKFIKLLHLRLGHKKITQEVLKALNLFTDINILKLQCGICSLVKLVNRPTGKGYFHRATHVNEGISFDSVGPFRYTMNKVLHKLQSVYGNNYLFNVIEFYSHYVWVFPINNKGEATKLIIKLINKINYQNEDNKIKSIHSDNAAEFVSRELVEYCENLGIIKTTTPAYSPSLNGLIERFNRTLVEIVKSMLLTCNISQRWFDEAAKYAAFVYNNTPNKQINYQTPQQVYLGYGTNINMLHVFGSNAFYKLAAPQASAGKFELVQRIGIFLGYQYDQTFAYRILGADNKIVITRNADIKNGEFSHIIKLNYQLDPRIPLLHEDRDINMEDEEDLWSDDEIQLTDQPIQPSNIEQIQDQKEQQQIQIETEKEQIEQMNEQLDQFESVENEMDVETTNNEQLEYEQVEYPLYDISEESSQHTSPESIETIETTTTPESIEETVRSVTPTESVRENIISELPSTEQSVSRYGRRRVTTTRYGGVNPLDLDPISRFQTFGFMTSTEQEPIKYEYGFTTTNRTNSIDDTKVTRLKDRIIIPHTLTQALNGSESKQWESATNLEIENMLLTNSFTLVDKPELVTKKAIPSRLLYSIKYDLNNDIDVFKCRLIALGYRQKAGIDFGDIYSPVCKLKSILVVLSIAVEHGFKVVMLDFTQAFMNANIDQETYILLPLDVASKYFNIKNSKHNLFRLNKALYGLHQSPILWFNTIRNYLVTTLLYQQLDTDVCIFIKYTSSGMIILTVYVDDTIATYDNESEHVWLNDKEKIQQVFKIKDLGDIKSLLKLEIIQVTPNIIVINQKGYVNRLVKEYGLEFTRPVNNPDIKNLIEEPTSDSLVSGNITKYQSLVGSLNYIATKTRPDISFSVNQLSRQLVKPTESHWKAAIKVLCYLKTTASMGIVLQKQNDNQKLFDLTVYADAAHGNQSDMKSTLGYLTFFNGNLVSWNCIKGKTIALSTMESELYAIMEGALELLYFKKLVFELITINAKSVIFTDSTSANALIRADRFHSRAKHIRIKFGFLRQELDKLVFNILWTDTNSMLADIVTKYLPTNQFQILRDQILYDTNTYIKSTSTSSSTTN